MPEVVSVAEALIECRLPGVVKMKCSPVNGLCALNGILAE